MKNLARTILLSLLAGAGTHTLGAQRVERNIPYRTNATPDQYMDVYAPVGTMRVPVVLFIHGGSLEETGEPADSVGNLVAEFVRNPKAVTATP